MAHGNILELSGTTGSGAAVGRAKGFREALNPNIKILHCQTGNFTRAEGKPVMEAFLKKYAGQIQGVFFHNDDMAIGAVEAIKAAGIKPGDLKMISIDGTRGGFQLMIDGWVQADVECNPLLGPQVIEMALKLMNAIEEEIRRQWLVKKVSLVHRIGPVAVGEASVVIAVSSVHRKEAFEACRYAIDTLKKNVPIWKKEFFADGEVWVGGETER